MFTNTNSYYFKNSSSMVIGYGRRNPSFVERVGKVAFKVATLVVVAMTML